MLGGLLLLGGCDAADDEPAPTPTVTRDAPDAAPTPTVAPTPTPAPEPAAAWERRADAPVALTEVAAAAFEGQVWVAGGFTANGAASAAVLVYEPDDDAWRAGPDLPQAVHHADLVATGDELLLVGGYVGSGFGSPTAQVWRLADDGGGWVEGPALPEPRAAGGAAWDGERLVYAGGVGPRGLAGEVFVREGGAWRQMGVLSEPREHLAVVGDRAGRVWVLAGRTAGLDTNLAAVDLVEGERVRRIGDVPTARGGLDGFHAPGIGACAVGGEEPTGTFDEVECIDAGGGVTTLAALSVPRHGLGTVVAGGTAYALLGGPDPGLAVSAVTEALPLGGRP